MLWDTHTHTHYSSDSQAEPVSMIQGARDKGLSGICITDHLDWDYASAPHNYQLDVDAYYKGCHQMLKEQQSLIEEAGDFQVCIGIEIGLQPHLAPRLNQMLDTYQFDFVIGSSHMAHGIAPTYPEYYINKTEDEAYEEFFSSILENLAVFDNFDVYGHLDYIVRYGPNKNKYYSYEKYKEVIDEVLKKLISMGKGIEINTAGFKYGLGHPHPTEAVIKRYRELGGEIITIGSDGHAPDQIAYDFQKVPGILKEAGFKYFTVFKERKPEFLLLP